MSGILLAGPTGQVGWELERALAPLGTVTALGRPELDLRNPDSIRKAVRATAPEIIINAAGYTAVDRAESEPEIAMQVNGIAPGVMAEEAKRSDALLIHYSTDYVFDGARAEPYVEEEEPNPLNVYGRTKLAGERAVAEAGCSHLILRASWIYNAQPRNFVLTMLRLGLAESELTVVEDQVGSPSWARTLATTTAALLQQSQLARAKPGIYHFSAAGYVTRFEFARRIFEIARSIAPGATGNPSLYPIASRDYPLPALRPRNASTSKEKLKRVFGIEMPRWEDQLHAFLQEFLSNSPLAT